MEEHKSHAGMEAHKGMMAKDGHYRSLLVMAGLSFIAMYLLMYSMVDVLGNVLNNFNQFYMAAIMTAPMVLIELFVMRSMYRNKRRNAAIAAASLVALVVFFSLIRSQGAITDRQFLRSMIPHHGAAILMCEQAPIVDEEIKALCQEIVSAQQAEIAQMKAILDRLDR